MEEQRELTFHNSVPPEDDDLLKARETAKKQKARVLAIFKECQSSNFTPIEIYCILQGDDIFNEDVGDYFILLTSVRRAITDLTKEGRLIKCQYSESRMGNYGKKNRVWRFNSEYISPLNPK